MQVPDKMAYANSADPNQTAPDWAVWSGSILCCHSTMYFKKQPHKKSKKEIFWHLRYSALSKMDININSFFFFFYFSTKTFFVGYLQCMFVSVEKYISIFIVLFLHITVFFERYVLCVLTEKISLSIHNLHFFVEKRKKKKKWKI